MTLLKAGIWSGWCERDSENEQPVTIRLIRRNNQVVPWNESKIEIRCTESLSFAHLDSEPAVMIARSVTDRLNQSGQAFLTSRMCRMQFKKK